MRLEDLIGNNVVRTQAIKLGDYMDTSYMHYPVYVKKYDGYTHTAVVTDFNNGYGAILGSEWLDDNWQPAGNIDQYKKAIVNGERAFLFYIEKGSVWIIADMEIGGNTPRYRVELMDFKLNTFEPILYTTVECRCYYCGGIYFIEYDEKQD